MCFVAFTEERCRKNSQYFPISIFYWLPVGNTTENIEKFLNPNARHSTWLRLRSAGCVTNRCIGNNKQTKFQVNSPRLSFYLVGSLCISDNTWRRHQWNDRRRERDTHSHTHTQRGTCAVVQGDRNLPEIIRTIIVDDCFSAELRLGSRLSVAAQEGSSAQCVLLLSRFGLFTFAL